MESQLLCKTLHRMCVKSYKQVKLNEDAVLKEKERTSSITTLDEMTMFNRKRKVDNQNFLQDCSKYIELCVQNDNDNKNN